MRRSRVSLWFLEHEEQGEPHGPGHALDWGEDKPS